MALTTVPVNSGMFCWFELTTRDVSRGRDFYKALMGAEANSTDVGGVEYTLFNVAGQTVAGLMPMDRNWPAEVPSHWMAYVAVDDVDATCRRAQELGGTVCVPPTDIPIGRFAVLTDPTGGTLSVFRAKPGATDGTNPVGPGAFVWCELVTTDVPRASEFYAKLLSWTPEFRTAGATSFIEMKVGRHPVASVFEACADDSSAATRAHWCPYLCVSDIDASLAAAVRNGGKKLCEPMLIPGMGRYAGISDPTGAHVALIEPLAT